MKRKLLVVVGTRPNFIKVTQFRKVANSYSHLFDLKIVHTGQHFDSKMSSVFFEQFNLKPDFYITLETKTPNSQIAEIMLGLEKVCGNYSPDLMMVAGDVNSTLAASITANKLGIKLAHIESGLRSFDRTMPEEINRIITDEITDYYFVTENSGCENLIKEGKNKDNIFFVGNTMIDTLVGFSDNIDASEVLVEHNLESNSFILMTMHRPSNVDDREGLEKLISIIGIITDEYKLVFPIHPRTIKKIIELNLYKELENNKNLLLLEPLDYFSFQKLIKNSIAVITDSGGIQEETTFYQIPCLTLRENTERPSTIDIGTNELTPFKDEVIKEKIENIRKGEFKKGSVPKYWDGDATKRIFESLETVF